MLCDAVCCSVLQGVAGCCSVLQCVAVCCSVCVAVRCSVMQCDAGCCSVWHSADSAPRVPAMWHVGARIYINDSVAV